MRDLYIAAVTHGPWIALAVTLGWGGVVAVVDRIAPTED